MTFLPPLLYAVWLAALLHALQSWWHPGMLIPPGWTAAAWHALTPFRLSGLVVAVARPALTAAGAGAFALLVAGAGMPVARWLVAPRRGSNVRVTLVAIGAGWWLTGAVIRAIGLSGVLFPAVLTAGAVALAFAGKPMNLLRLIPRPRSTRLSWLYLGTGLASLLAATLPTVVPDVRTYHLGAPEAYLEVHRIFAHPWDWSWHLGLATEDVLLPVDALGGLMAAKAVNVALLISLCVALAMIGKEQFGEDAGWWAGALFAGCGLVPSTILYGKTDLGSILAVTIAAGVLLGGTRQRRLWLAAGGLAGWAFTAKFTAGFAMFGLVAAGLVATSWRSWPVRLFLFTVGGLAVVGPLFAANWLWLHAPLYPFAAGVSGGLGWTPALDDAVHRAWKTLLGINDLSPAALLGNALWFGRPEFGSLVLGVVLPLAVMRRRSAAERSLAVFLWVSYAGLLVINQYPRYMGVLLPMACLVAATAMPAGRPGRIAITLLLLAGLGVESIRLLSRAPAGAMGFLAGQVSGPAIADPAGDPGTLTKAWLNRHATASDRVLIGWEQRWLGLHARQFSTTIWAPGPAWTWADEARTAEELAKRYRQAGITLVAHNLIRARFAELSWEPGPPWSDRALRVYRDYVSRFWTPVYLPEAATFESGAYYVWRVDHAPHVPVTVLALPGTEGRMRPVFVLLQAGDGADALTEARRLAAPLGTVTDAEDTIALALCAAGRGREALPTFARERRGGYLSERNLAWEAAVLRGLGRPAAARSVEDEALRLSGGAPAALLRHPLLEHLLPIPR